MAAPDKTNPKRANRTLRRLEWEYMLGLFRQGLNQADVRRAMVDHFGFNFSSELVARYWHRGSPKSEWAKRPMKEIIDEEKQVTRGILRAEEEKQGVPAFRRLAAADAAEQLKIESQGVRGSMGAAITMLGSLSKLRVVAVQVADQVAAKLKQDILANAITVQEGLELLDRLARTTHRVNEAFHVSQKSLRLYFGAPEKILGVTAVGGPSVFDGHRMYEELGEQTVRQAMADMLEGRMTDEVEKFLEWQDRVDREEAISVEARVVQ